MIKKYRVVSKIRFTVFIALILLMIFIGLGIAFRPVYVEAGSTEVKYETVMVESGDTLWDIANRYSDKTTDLRKFIYEITKLNNINGSELIPGQEIKIPLW